MTMSEILTFAVVASLPVMSPGPNDVLVAKTVPTSGRPAGFANVAGFVTAFYLHGTMAIFGISVILVHSAAAFPHFIKLGETTPFAAFTLVFIHAMINAVWFSAMILVLSRLTAVARNATFQRWLKSVTGVVFLGFGVRLAAYRPSM